MRPIQNESLPGMAAVAWLGTIRQHWAMLAAIVLALNLARIVHFSTLHELNCQWSRPSILLEEQNARNSLAKGRLGDRTPSPTFSDIIAARFVPKSERNNMQRVYADASRIFQERLAERQIGRDCSTKTVVRYTVTKQDRNSTLAELNDIAAVLLFTLVNEEQLTVLSLDGVTLPSNVRTASCESYDCLFLPLTSCAAGSVSYEPKTNCDKNEMVLKLVEMLDLEEIPDVKLLDWSFFMRESLRFIVRPSEKLSRYIISMRENEFEPVNNWQPFRRYASRVAVYIPEEADRSYHERFVKGLKIQVYAQGGSGLHQVLLRTDRASQRDQFKSDLVMKDSSSEKDWRFRSFDANGGIIPVLATSISAKQDTVLMTIAQAFVFAECDFFVGDFQTNFARFVGVLMRMMRFSVYAPTWDVRGMPFDPHFAVDGHD